MGLITSSPNYHLWQLILGNCHKCILVGLIFKSSEKTGEEGTLNTFVLKDGNGAFRKESREDRKGDEDRAEKQSFPSLPDFLIKTVLNFPSAVVSESAGKTSRH